ncbi:MAG: ABC transporter permease [Blastocatellia bacterium]|nr:ABC transporter permease [Blastocatellia bacterium]
MPYELFIALRYLRAKRRQGVLSTITLISMLGISVGVWALVVVLAFQSGMESEIQTKILGGTAHLNLLKEDESSFNDAQSLVAKVEKVAGVRAAAATVYVEVLISGTDKSRAAILKAVDFTSRPEANEVFQTIVEGSVDALKRRQETEAGVVVGKELAAALGLKLGDVATVISPQGRLTPAGIAPRQKFFTVVGIFQSGLFDYDANWGYISMESAQELLLNPEAAGVIQMKVADIYRVKETSAAVLAVMGPGFKTTDWQQLNQSVFAALNLQRLGFFVGIGLIILVASLNIITTLIMMVVEKHRDIAILMGMGATRRSILIIFILQGVIIGFVGMAIGVVVGGMTCWTANTYKLIQLDPRIYSISYVPFQMRVSDLLIVALMSVIISFVATIYPARKASSLIPVEALRYE